MKEKPKDPFYPFPLLKKRPRSYYPDLVRELKLRVIELIEIATDLREENAKLKVKLKLLRGVKK